MNSEHWDSERGRKLLQRLLRKRLGKPADLDELLLLLASDPSGFINRAVITVDDGFTAANPRKALDDRLHGTPVLYAARALGDRLGVPGWAAVVVPLK